jgi:Mce-associated membrane protein
VAVDAVTAGFAVADAPDEVTERDGGTPDNLDRPRGATALPGKRRRPVRQAVVAGLALLLVVAGLTGWLGYQGYQAHQAQLRDSLYLQTARQGAINLTTINYSTVDADVQRILESATGTFYDDFQQRSAPFVEVVRQAKSTSVGTVTAAGIESESDNGAQVLVAVTVRTSTPTEPQQDPRSWRMRIAVQRVDGGEKVSNVEFVP